MRVVRRLVPLLLLLAACAAAPCAAWADYAHKAKTVPGVGTYTSDGKHIVRLTPAGALPVGRPIPRAGRDFDVWAVSPLTGTVVLQHDDQRQPLRMDGTTGRWSAVGPPDPRRTLLVDPLPAADRPVWIRSIGAVLLRSTDDGRTWQRWARGPEIPGTTFRISTLAWDPSAPGAVLVGTFGGHLYRLDAKGRWHHLGLTRLGQVRFDWVTGIVVDPARPKEVLLSFFAAGIGRSVDGGRTFTILRPRFRKRGIMALVGAPGGHGWAMTFDGHDFVTRNGGRSWATAERGIPRDYRGYLTEIAPDGANPGAAFAISKLDPLLGWYAGPDGHWVELPAVYGG